MVSATGFGRFLQKKPFSSNPSLSHNTEDTERKRADGRERLIAENTEGAEKADERGSSSELEIAGMGGVEVLNAATEEALLGEFLDGDDLGGDENGMLAWYVGHGDVDDGVHVVAFAGLEAQAPFGHVLTGDNVVSAIEMADAGGVIDFDARVFPAIGAGPGRFGRG
jgi:hypothetical protein